MLWRSPSRLQRVSALAAVSLAALSACADDSVTSPQSTQRQLDLANVQLQAAASGRTERGFEDEMLRMELSLPGFGGLAMADDGTLVVHLPPGVSTATGAAALEGKLARVGRGELSDAFRRPGAVRYLTARYAFSTLVSWKEAMATAGNGRSTIHGIDADELNNRLTLYVSDASARQAAIARATDRGIPAEALRIVVSAPPQATASLRDRFRPTGAGTQIRNNVSGRCTLGFNANTWPGLVDGLVTAAHCASGPVGVGATGQVMYQNSFLSGDIVGTISTNPAFNLTAGACGSFTKCANADALFTAYNANTTRQKRVAFTASTGLNYAGGSITVTGWWTNVASPGSVFQGQTVDKMGRTTGWTRGSVSATCVVGDIDSNADLVADYRILCSHTVTNSRAGQGDSGGPVFIPPPAGQITQPLTPLGILYAGNNMTSYDMSDQVYFCSSGCTYWFSDWSAVQAHLNLVLLPN